MLHCKERYESGWRKAKGYWGIILQQCGEGNTKSNRKQLYMSWKRNVNNFREKFFERVKYYTENKV